MHRFQYNNAFIRRDFTRTYYYLLLFVERRLYCYTYCCIKNVYVKMKIHVSIVFDSSVRHNARYKKQNTMNILLKKYRYLVFTTRQRWTVSKINCEIVSLRPPRIMRFNFKENSNGFFVFTIIRSHIARTIIVLRAKKKNDNPRTNIYFRLLSQVNNTLICSFCPRTKHSEFLFRRNR